MISRFRSDARLNGLTEPSTPTSPRLLILKRVVSSAGSVPRLSSFFRLRSNASTLPLKGIFLESSCKRTVPPTTENSPSDQTSGFAGVGAFSFVFSFVSALRPSALPDSAVGGTSTNQFSIPFPSIRTLTSGESRAIRSTVKVRFIRSDEPSLKSSRLKASNALPLLSLTSRLLIEARPEICNDAPFDLC